MSKEYRGYATSGLGSNAMFHLIRQTDSKRWNTATPGLEDFSSGNYSDYELTATEEGANGSYTGDMPAGAPAGDYSAVLFEKNGGEGNDIRHSVFQFHWNGSAVVSSPPGNLDSAIALVSMDQLKELLKITGSAEDTIVANTINRASELAATYCGRRFVVETYTEFYDGKGKKEMLLRNYPINSVTSLNVDIERDFDSDTDIDVSADVMIDKKAGILRLWNDESTFAKGRGNVKVVYSAGYTAGTNVPYDLQDAVLMICMHFYKRIYQDQRIGLQSETIGDRNLTYRGTEIPVKARKILDYYKAIHTPDEVFE